MKRILKHLVAPRWIVYRAFPRAALRRIEELIANSETSHDGELRFVVEAGLPLMPLLRAINPRQRAHEVF